MKEKIIAAIKAKFPAINLSKPRLNAIAAKIEAKIIDDETKIDGALDTYNEYNPLADIAKADDKLRDLESKSKGKKEDTPTEDKKEVAPPDDAPEWAKALIEQNKALAQSVAAMQGEKVQNSIKSKATEKLKEVPNSYWGKRALPEKDEDLDAFVTEVAADYAQFKQEMTDQGLSVLAAPRAGGASQAATKVSPEIQAFVAKTMPKTEIK